MNSSYNKYKNKPVVIDGIRFASGREGSFYVKLKLLKKAGIVTKFDMQVKYMITKKRYYLLDFKVWYADGDIQYIDVKGFRTPVYKLKKDIVEDKYGIKITEV